LKSHCSVSTEAVTIRHTVARSDMENVRKIVESSGFFSDEEVEIAVELVEERLTKGIPSGYHFLFVESEGKVIAYTCFGRIPCTKASYDLYWIAVHDAFRGRGIGKKLLAATEREIAAQGGQRIYIETSSRQKYEPTRSFYEHCGYKQEAELKNFYSPGDAKVVYVKEINPSEPCSTLDEATSR